MIHMYIPIIINAIDIYRELGNYIFKIFIIFNMSL